MLPWEKRPFEIANLLNPAFCSILMYVAVNDFEQEKQQGMPFALSFLVLPFVLHKPTRETLPQTIRTTLQEWVRAQPEEFSMLFAMRTRQLVPYSKEALMFGMQCHIVESDISGNIGCNKKIDIEKFKETPAAILIEKSKLLGKWFAKTEEETVIFKTLGIRL